uniref:Uncharacterized protein n=1 Tax=Panagrolaimus sp. PS1159 TaxID=55785 RepID=A0AC35GMW5_9BILA
MSSTAAATMEALKSDLIKAIQDFTVYIKNGVGKTAVENQPFDAVLSKITSILTFCQALITENAQLLKSNNGLKSTRDHLVQGIAQINIGDKDLQVENAQLKQENGELKASNNDLIKKISELIQTCGMKEAEKKALEQKVGDLEGLVSSYEAVAAEGRPELPLLQEYSQQTEATQTLGDSRAELEQKDKFIANLEEKIRELTADKVQDEKTIATFKKMIEDQSKYVQKLEKLNNNGNLLLENPVNRLSPVDHLPSGNSNNFILLKDALNGNKLNLSLVHNKVLVVKRLLSTNDNMIWNAYSTFDDVNEKPVEVNIKNAAFKLHLNGFFSLHKMFSPLLFSMIDSCSLIDVRLYYITINYSQFMKLFSSATIKTVYLVSVVIKDENGQDMPMDKILHDISNVERLSFIFPRLAHVSANTFTRLPHFPKLRKVTFGNIPEHIDESVVIAFEKKYPSASCFHTFRGKSNYVSDDKALY